MWSKKSLIGTKNLKLVGRFFLVFLLGLFLSWPLFSQVSQVSPTSQNQFLEPNQEEQQASQEYLQAVQAIYQKYPETRPLLQQMDNALKKKQALFSQRQEILQTQVQTLSAQVTQLQTQTTDLKTSLTGWIVSSTTVNSDLYAEIDKWKTLFAISATVNGVQFGVNLYEFFKK